MRYFLTVLMTTLMAWHSHAQAQVAMIILDDIPGNMKVCVTNYGPTIAAAELSIGVVSGRVSAIEGQVIKWNTAYGWGDHHQQGYATTGNWRLPRCQPGRDRPPRHEGLHLRRP